VSEETGAHGRSLGKLGDVRYWFHWEGERVFKVVSFFLLVHEGGELGDVDDEFRHEIDEVSWLPLDEADRLLTHKGEREMAGRALARLSEQDV
jgi:8-oxo-dGTP pyrophosphatase MutT (NUDIX family)